MECSSANCISTGGDRMVSCWLCLNIYHLKCSNLKARDADALADPLKSLNWTCPSCKNINIEFYKLFKNSKDEFNLITKEFLLLQNKLAKFGELFNNFPNLENFVNMQQNLSPKRKKAHLRSDSSQNTRKITPDSNNSSASVVEISSQPRNNFVSGSTSVSVADTPNSLEPLPASSGIPPIANNSSIAPERNLNYAQILTSSSTISNNIQVAPKPLKAIPPNKNIFLSRLAAETTAEDVEYYIRSKLQSNCEISVYKYTYSQPRTITSFKIAVPEDLFEHLVDPSFWPVSTFVREYVYKESRRTAARLPIRISTTPKN